MFSQVTEKMKKKKFLLLIKQYPHRANIFICMFKRSLPMKAEGKRYEIVENTLLLKTLGNCRILLIGNWYMEVFHSIKWQDYTHFFVILPSFVITVSLRLERWLTRYRHLLPRLMIWLWFSGFTCERRGLTSWPWLPTSTTPFHIQSK